MRSIRSQTHKLTKRTFQTTPENNPSELVYALVLLGNAGVNLTREELISGLIGVTRAAGIDVQEQVVVDFLAREHEIVKYDDAGLVERARLLCVKGGDENPNAAAVARVLDVAGFQMDKALVEQLMGKSEEQIEQKPSSRWGVAAVATGAAVLMGKTKYLLVALKLTKMTPLISMLLTSFMYSFVFGWPYALGMVGQLLLHESGHAAVMRHYGVPFSPMVFIPFLGASVAMKDQPKNAYEEAMIAFGGPVAGSAAAALLAVVGASTDSALLIALADFGLMINLFNLLPIGSLDGGRIASALSPWLNVAGLVGGGFIIYVGAIHNPIFYLIMLAGTYTTVMRFISPPNQAYSFLTSAQRLQVGVAYLALIGLLLWGMRENNKRRLTPKQIQDVRQGRKAVPDPESFFLEPEPEDNQPRWA